MWNIRFLSCFRRDIAMSRDSSSGRMRRASAADEVRAMLDPRSREQEGYGIIVLLASVIVSLGDLAGVDTQVIEALSEEDLTYLREQYRILNEA